MANLTRWTMLLNITRGNYGSFLQRAAWLILPGGVFRTSETTPFHTVSPFGQNIPVPGKGQHRKRVDLKETDL